MKKILIVFIIIALITSSLTIISCTCSSEQIKNMPYGVVIDEDGNPDEKAWSINEIDEWKTKLNKRIDIEKWLDDGGRRSEVYQKIEYVVHVKNTGATGIVTFTGTVYDYPEDGLLGDDQYPIALSLESGKDDYIRFYFWLKGDATNRFKVEAINVADFVIEEN